MYRIYDTRKERYANVTGFYSKEAADEQCKILNEIFRERRYVVYEI